MKPPPPQGFLMFQKITFCLSVVTFPEYKVYDLKYNPACRRQAGEYSHQAYQHFKPFYHLFSSFFSNLPHFLGQHLSLIILFFSRHLNDFLSKCLHPSQFIYTAVIPPYNLVLLLWSSPGFSRFVPASGFEPETQPLLRVWFALPLSYAGNR